MSSDIKFKPYLILILLKSINSRLSQWQHGYLIVYFYDTGIALIVLHSSLCIVAFFCKLPEFSVARRKQKVGKGEPLLSWLACCCGDKHHDPKQPEEEKPWSQQELKAVKGKSELPKRPWRAATHWLDWFVFLLAFSHLSYTAQHHLPRNGIAHSGLGPPPSSSIQEGAHGLIGVGNSSAEVLPF